MTIDSVKKMKDALCEKLTELGADGLVIEDEADFRRFLEENRQYWDYVDEELEARYRGVSRVKLYVEDTPGGRAQLAAFTDGTGLEPECRTVADEDWAESWKQYYKPMEIGDRLLVVPEWLREDPKVRAGLAAGRVALVLDPGLTFGTGSHATTRLCLTALEKTIRGGEVGFLPGGGVDLHLGEQSIDLLHGRVVGKAGAQMAAAPPCFPRLKHQHFSLRHVSLKRRFRGVFQIPCNRLMALGHAPCGGNAPGQQDEKQSESDPTAFHLPYSFPSHTTLFPASTVRSRVSTISARCSRKTCFSQASSFPALPRFSLERKPSSTMVTGRNWGLG